MWYILVVVGAIFSLFYFGAGRLQLSALPTRNAADVPNAPCNLSIPGVRHSVPAVRIIKPLQVAVSMGKLSYGDGGYINQPVSVQNGTGRSLQFVKVECGFYSCGNLVASGYTEVRDLAPRSIGFNEISANSRTRPNDLQCRVSYPPTPPPTYTHYGDCREEPRSSVCPH
jgi:hypothetical protein